MLVFFKDITNRENVSRAMHQTSWNFIPNDSLEATIDIAMSLLLVIKTIKLQEFLLEQQA